MPADLTRDALRERVARAQLQARSRYTGTQVLAGKSAQAEADAALAAVAGAAEALAPVFATAADDLDVLAWQSRYSYGYASLAALLRALAEAGNG